MIDEHLAGHVDQTTARIYAAPTRISVGQALSAPDLVSGLQMAGYGTAEVPGAPGWYAAKGDAVEIHPEADSYFAGKNALRVEFAGRNIQSHPAAGRRLLPGQREIEPQLLTNLFDSSREKRRRVRFEDIPKVLVRTPCSPPRTSASSSIPVSTSIRIMGAAWADLRHDAQAQGASTLTMQLSRSFFFSTERTWRRKLAETMVSLELEHRFTKQQIFELYANEIYLGNRGSFAIHGFAEGSLAYFNKDIRDITLGEAAFLAGIIRAPNRYSSADQRPERAAEARDRVLTQMVENGYITPQQARDAKRAPLQVVPGGLGNSDAPYFVDMVKDHLLDRFSEAELLSQSFRVYTTLDPELERAATEAISIGIANVDQQLAPPLCALGESRACRRSRRWRWSRSIRTPARFAPSSAGATTARASSITSLARRQPGSVFKPFVYAAAFDNAVEGLSARGHSGDDGRGRAHHVRFRRPGVHAEQLRRGVPRHGDAARSADAIRSTWPRSRSPR